MKKTVFFLPAVPGIYVSGSELALASARSCAALQLKQVVPGTVLVTDAALMPAANHVAACLRAKNVAPIDCSRMRCAESLAAAVSVADDVSFLMANLVGLQLPLAGPCLVVATRDDVIQIGQALLGISVAPEGYDLAGTIVEGNVYGVHIALGVAKVSLSGYFPSRKRWEGVGKFPLRREVRQATVIA